MGRNESARRKPRLRQVVDERGAGLAEFALVLPILLIMLFGIVEFGIAFNRPRPWKPAPGKVPAWPHCRARRRRISTPGSLPPWPASLFDGTPVVAPPPEGLCAGRAGQAVTVVVTANHNINIPPIINTTIPLSGQAVFRCEG